MTASSRSRLIALALAAAAAAFCAPAADAGDQSAGRPPPEPEKKPLEMKAWGGVAVDMGSWYHPGGWVPVTVELRNNTRTDEKRKTKGVTYRGQVVIESNFELANSSYVARHAISYESPEQSVKRYTVPVWLRGGETSIHARVYDRGREELEAFAALAPVRDDSPIVIVVQDRTSPRKLEQILKGNPRLPQSPQSEGPERKPLIQACVPAALPRRGEHLLFADAIVIAGAPEGLFEAECLEALSDYAKLGGSLIIACGGEFDRYAGSPLGEMLGVIMTRNQVLMLSRLSSLGAMWAGGRSPLAEKGFRVPKLSPLPGCEVFSAEYIRASDLESTGVIDPLVSADVVGALSLPTVVTRRCGAGRASTVALDLDAECFERWEGSRPLLRDLLDGRERNGTGFSDVRPDADPSEDGPASLRSAMYATLDDTSFIKAPSRGWIGAFLAIYMLALIALPYFLFNAFERRELAWVVVPVVAGAFALYVYGAGYWGRSGDLSVTQAAVIETSSGEELGRASCFAAVYSPVRRSYDIDLPAGTLVTHLPGPAKTRGAEDYALDVEHGRNPRLRGLYIHATSLRFIETRSLMSLGGSLKGTVALGPGRMEATITNGTDSDLVGCVVAAGSKGFVVGRIAKGESRTVAGEPKPLADEISRALYISRAEGGRTYSGLSDLAGSGDKFARRAVGEMANCLMSRRQEIPGGALIGWTRKRPLELAAGGRPITHPVGVSMILCRLPLLADGEARTVSGDGWQSMPKGSEFDDGGVWPPEKVVGKGTIKDLTIDAAGNRALVVETALRPCLPTTGMRAAALRLSGRVTGKRVTWQMSLLDAGTGRWVDVGPSSGGGANIDRLSVPEPSRFVNPVTGAISARITATAAVAAQEDVKIKVERFDAELDLVPARARRGEEP